MGWWVNPASKKEASSKTKQLETMDSRGGQRMVGHSAVFQAKGTMQEMNFLPLCTWAEVSSGGAGFAVGQRQSNEGLWLLMPACAGYMPLTHAGPAACMSTSICRAACRGCYSGKVSGIQALTAIRLKSSTQCAHAPPTAPQLSLPHC